MHHVQIEPVARDARRLLIFDEDVAKARRIAFGPLHDLGLVTARFFAQTRCLTTRARHDVVRIRLTFVLRTLAILARFYGVVERGLYLFGRLHTLQRHFLHVDAGAVAIEHLLHQLLGLLRDLLAPFVKNEVHLRLADDLADRRLGDERRDLIGLAVVEDVGLGAFQVVLDRELDVDDVLIVRQHHGLFVDLVLGRIAVADLDRLHLREVDQLYGLHRKRQMPARAREHGLRVFAEAGDDPAATFVYDVETACKPNQQRERDEEPRAAQRKFHLGTARAFGRRFFAGGLASEQLGESAVDVAPDLIEVGRSAAPAALAPLRIVERHDGASASGGWRRDGK